MTPALLTILADDLTGALDAGAPLATPAAPVAVAMTPADARAPRLSLSTETRDGVPPAQAADLVAQVLAGRRARIGTAGLWFKKIDSMLRGPWAAEVAAAAAGFERIVVAPAFPDMGRRMAGGVQSARQPDGAWQPVGPPVAQALARAGLPSWPWHPGDGPPATGVLVADAASRGDLDRIVAALAGAPSVLWVGSGGLAEALGGHPACLPAPPPCLFLVGTAHPVTLAQTDRLRAAVPMARLLAPGRGVVGAAAARAALDEAIAGLLAGPVPRGIFVTGGATLARLMRLADATGLEALGRIAPGLPVSRIQGGRWDGVTVVSKSGGFGDPDLMARLAGG